MNTEWAQVEVVDLVNDGSGLGFGIIGGRSTGVVVKTIVPGGVSDRVSASLFHFNYYSRILLQSSFHGPVNRSINHFCRTVGC